jgi:Flp pilus assembly protein TadG
MTHLTGRRLPGRHRPATPHRPLRRGQSLVEFALLLPVLLLLVVGAIDLGRVYLGTISVQNAAKEGAFLGARRPTCDVSGGDGCDDPQNVASRVTTELDGIAADSITARCYPAGTTVFTSGWRSDLADCVDGDLYRVTVNTTFRIATPFIGALIGDSLPVNANATAVVITSFTGFGDPGGVNPDPTTLPTLGPGECEVPNFTNGTRLAEAQDLWANVAGFGTTATTIGPNGQEITWQSLPAGTRGPCATTPITVSNVPQATPTPTPSPSPSPTPEPTPEPTPTPVGATPTPTPDPTPTPSPTPTPEPTPPQCTVPQMAFSGRGNALTVTEAETRWRGAGFRVENFQAVRPPMSDYMVGWQSREAGSELPCLTGTVRVGP